MMRLVLSMCLSVALVVAAGCSGGQDPNQLLDPALRLRSAPWAPEVLDTLGRLPVQDGGRVKPLSTVAQFALLSMNGNRDLKVEWRDRKDRLTAFDWLLDCFFYPEQARHYRCLRVDNDETIEALGLRVPGRKRLDRYSYAEVAPAHEKLVSLAREFRKIEPKLRTPVQGQIVDLFEAMHLLDRLLAFLDFGRHEIEMHRTEGLARAFPGASKRSSSFVLQNLGTLSAMSQVLGGGQVSMEETTKERETQALRGIFDEFERAASGGSGLAVFAPVEATEKTWYSLPDLVGAAVEGHKPAAQHVALMEPFENMVRKRDQPVELLASAKAALEASRQVASARGEYGKVGLEVSYYRADFFYRALLVFGLAFVLAAVSWLLPGSRLVVRAVTWCTLAAWVTVVVGIVYRCVIRSRPPVSTLYETILFVTAVGVLVGLLMEWINRQRIGVTLAALGGLLGMFLARKFEELEGADTMPQLVAVLDTNFWLSTHVTTVTMGYSAGLLASLLAHVLIFAKLLGIDEKLVQPVAARMALGPLVGRTPVAKRTSISRMIYGTVCFGLLFSVVGTILGGIWANYSWGRFWGWDPKENGALLICLAQIAILHGRMAGWLRDLGMALSSIGLGVVVAFSWWHVNQLGVGLHAYGFTEGILTALYWFYFSQAVVFALGLVVWARQRAATAVAKVAAAEPTAAS